MLRDAQGVAGEGVLEAHGRRDVTRVDLVDLLAMVRVHLEDAADPLALPLDRVEHVRACLERPRVDPEERQLAHERVRGDLERQGREGLLVGDLADGLLIRVGVDAQHRRHVERRRQVVDDRVEHRLDALVLERGAREDAHDARGERAGPQAALDLRDRELLALEVLEGQLVVHLSDRVQEERTVLERLGHEVLRDVRLDDVLAQVIVVLDRLHAHQVDDALELVLAADRDLDGHELAIRVAAEAVADRVDAAPEVRAGAIELVDEADARHAIAVRLAPDRLGLGLHARDAVEHDDRAVQDAQRSLHLDGEVHVPGRIDDVDPMVAPERRRRSGGDGDPALLLLRHPVHRRRALMHLADLVDLLGVEEDALGDGRLAGVDMGDDADVPRTFERDFACHDQCLPVTT